MGKKVVVIATSLRPNSNSDRLAREFERGAADAGHDVTYISLKGKKIAFCTGCMACAAAGECAIKDDAVEIERAVVNADVVAWATPVYYWQMSGAMKTLMDRLNPMFPKACAFRDVYALTAAQENEPYIWENAASGVKAWAGNFKQARFAGGVFCGGVDAPGEIEGNPKLAEAYEAGLKC